MHLSPQPFKVLSLLVAHPGELITREQFRQQIWGRDTFVDFEHGLNFAVKKIRDTLGDDAEHPRYIQTLPRRGYRFIGKVEEVNDAPAELHADAHTGAHQGSSLRMPVESPPFSSHRGRSASWAVTVSCILILSAAGFWLRRIPLPAPRVTEYTQITHDARMKEVAAADENRLYVNLYTVNAIAEAPLGGGEVEPIPISIPGEDKPVAGLAPLDYPSLYDIAKVGSTILSSGPSYGLWSVGATGNPLKHLGTAESAAWSPDGKYIVYSWLGDIFIMQSDGTNARMLVSSAKFSDGPHFNSEFDWSPDGTRIRFTRNNSIWEVKVSGSDPGRLFRDWRPSSWKCCGRWTVDGAFYVFLTGEPIGEPDVPPLLSGNHIWAFDERRHWLRPTIQEPIQLTPSPIRWGPPIPSRDGTKIFVRGITRSGELIRFDSLSGEWTPFLGGKSAEFVSFSRDGKSVAYVSYPEGMLWRANPDGTGAVRLFDVPLKIKSVEWAPAGNQILISARDGDNPLAMYAIPSQGGPPKRLLPDDKMPEGDAHWSPDARRVVYCTANDSWKTFGPVEIRILEIATGETRAIPSSGEDFSPRWSPDGRYIATLTMSEHKLKVFDLHSGRWTVLVDRVSNFPNWSSDGRFIYFEGGEVPGAILRVPVSGGKPQIFALVKGIQSTGSLGSWLGLDLTDAPLLLRDKGIDEIYALTLTRK